MNDSFILVLFFLNSEFQLKTVNHVSAAAMYTTHECSRTFGKIFDSSMSILCLWNIIEHFRRLRNLVECSIFLFIPNCSIYNIKAHPNLGSAAMARGLSMSPAMSVRRCLPSSRATSTWCRLLSTQYRLPAIQSTARPSAVDNPDWITGSIRLRAINRYDYYKYFSVIYISTKTNIVI